jgi:hypothetical protein
MPTNSKAQVLGSGCTLAIGGVTGVTPAPTPLDIGELTDIKVPSMKRDTTTNTNFATGDIKQYLATLLDFGVVTCSYNRVSTDAGQLAVIAAVQTKSAYDFTLTLEPNPLIGQTSGDVIALSGIVTEAGGFDTSQTKVASGSFSMQLNSYSFTAGTIAS